MKFYYCDPSWIHNMICSNAGNPLCDCYKDGLPRDVLIHNEKGHDPTEIIGLCNSCRNRMIESGDIQVEVPPADIFPTDFPKSFLLG